MQKSGLASLAICFYDFKEDRKKDVSGLLSSVLFQLCDQSDSYHNILSAFYSMHRNGAQSPGDDKLVQCLMDLLKCPGPQPVYLIIDALDECPSTSSLSSPRESSYHFWRTWSRHNSQTCAYVPPRSTSRPSSSLWLSVPFPYMMKADKKRISSSISSRLLIRIKICKIGIRGTSSL